MRGFLSMIGRVSLVFFGIGRAVSPAQPRILRYTPALLQRGNGCVFGIATNAALLASRAHVRTFDRHGTLHNFPGALGGTRTPTILLTATSRQRVYQFRHERFLGSARALSRTGSTARDVTNQ